MKWEQVSEFHSIAYDKDKRVWLLHYDNYDVISPKTHASREAVMKEIEMKMKPVLQGRAISAAHKNYNSKIRFERSVNRKY